jgi:8-oxo-dGTP diphosphatase
MNRFALITAPVLSLAGLAFFISSFWDQANQAWLLSVGLAVFLGSLSWFAKTMKTIWPSVDANAQTPLPQETTSDATEVELLASLTDLTDVTTLIREARTEILAMVLSGRNFFSARCQTVIEGRIRAANDPLVIRVLALDHFAASEFVAARQSMMDMGRNQEYEAIYEGNLQEARETGAQIQIKDPRHLRFNMRLYDMLPTTYFYIIDGTLYLGSLLSKPVSRSPLFVVKPGSQASDAVIKAYRRHFDHYWIKSRFYVTMIGMREDGQTLLVKNRTRAWEWPTGYIEPDEVDLEGAAKREFAEETGLRIASARLLDTSPGGYYYVGLIGEEIHKMATREVAALRYFEAFPPPDETSFPADYSRHKLYLQRARILVPDLVKDAAS